MNILVVGGAGYIGSHMVKHLGLAGCAVTTLDNLSGGHADAVLHGTFVQGDIADRALLDRLLAEGRFDAVMHFASFIQVGESVVAPAKYYQNNVVNTLNLLDAMVAAGVKRFIFRLRRRSSASRRATPSTSSTGSSRSTPMAARS
ncbi:UDP-glucose 4-epimerase [Hydrogenophaga sp. T4]|nr:UDP-glucose 4-epimerase [Hydrogenophaga sp. T4]